MTNELWFDSHQGQANFFLLFDIKSICGVLSANEWTPTGHFPGIEWLGLQADRPSPPSAEVRNAWSHTSTPKFVLMSLFMNKHRGSSACICVIVPTLRVVRRTWNCWHYTHCLWHSCKPHVFLTYRIKGLLIATYWHFLLATLWQYCDPNHRITFLPDKMAC
jgi:hypothetical protein